LRRLTNLLAKAAMACLVLAILGALGLAWALNEYGRDLPDYRQLADYAPPTVTRIHAGDGRLLAEYARERRVFVPIEAIPERVKRAFVAAEDQHFYQHPGIDISGILRAAIGNIERLKNDQRPQGGSTITQQVAKNFLIGGEVSYERKIKEAILAWRIERAFSKDRILELYLNEIFLGHRSYGVAAAALNYFNKSLDDLTLGEAAFLAGLPKAPARYDPRRDPAAALARRDYALGRMLEDGYITAEEAAAARAEPLELRTRDETEVASADFFTETVRRQLVERFGEAGFYEGGLSVRTTVMPPLQTIVDRALRRGLVAFDRRRGWRGPLGRIDGVPAGDWAARLAGFDPGFELMDWRLAVVLKADAGSARLRLADGSEATLGADEVGWARRPALESGDLVVVERVEEAGEEPRWALRQRPEVEGAAVALDPHNGRVLAMSGGFSFRQSQFDRATQAKRQPGSAFKPFVYLAALEQGYTPASIVVDGPFVYDPGPGQPLWKPQNYSERFYGPSTLRLGVEKSRNLMTVRLASEIGMERVVDVARRFEVADGLQPYLAGALGSGEVDLLHLTTAYAMLVNGGKRIRPAFVERIQDRNGHTVLRRDERPCLDCAEVAWAGQAPPRLPDTREQVEDPRVAYQMVNILEGVVQRGTAAKAAELGRPLAGKTGTTNDSKDAWFIGFSPDLVVGVWVGYDRPRSLGDRETGASVALPIWIEIMQAALDGQPPVPFRTPPGVSIVKVDAETGLLPGPGTKTVIAEAFLPGTEPWTTSQRVQDTDLGYTDLPAGAAPRAPGGGGLY
jgi:penicillin-binding protein 1A